MITTNSINIELTKKCNLNCSYCYLSCGMKERRSLKKMDVFDFLERFSESGRYVMFTGGEIFTLDYIDDVLRFAYDCGLQISIFTNGTLAMSHQKAISDYVFKVNTSLDGTRSINDALRGTTFDKVNTFLQWLSESGIQHTVQSMVTPASFVVKEELYETLVRYSPSEVKLAHITQMGRGTSNPDILNDNQIYDMVSMSEEFSERTNYKIMFSTNLVDKHIFEEVLKPNLHRLSPWLQSDGSISMMQSDLGKLKISDITSFPLCNDNYEGFIDKMRSYQIEKSNKYYDIMEIVRDLFD